MGFYKGVIASAAFAFAALVAQQAEARKLAIMFVTDDSRMLQEAIEMKSTFLARGYEVLDLWNAPHHRLSARDVTEWLRAASNTMGTDDQVVLSLSCHGTPVSQWPQVGDPGQHVCCVDRACTEKVSTEALIGLVRAMPSTRISVIDRSCYSGNTVLAFGAALPEVCAISVTSDSGNAIIDTPRVSWALNGSSTFAEFAQNTQLRLMSLLPNRIFQRIFTTGCTSTMELRAELWFSSTGLITEQVRTRALFPYLYPNPSHLYSFRHSHAQTAKDTLAALKRAVSHHLASRTISKGMSTLRNRLRAVEMTGQFEERFAAIQNHYATAGFRVSAQSADDLHAQITAQIARIEEQYFYLAGRIERLDRTLGRLLELRNEVGPPGLRHARLRLHREEALRSETEQAETERQSILATQSTLEALVTGLNPILSAVEDLICEASTSPCGAMAI